MSQVGEFLFKSKKMSEGMSEAEADKWLADLKEGRGGTAKRLTSPKPTSSGRYSQAIRSLQRRRGRSPLATATRVSQATPRATQAAQPLSSPRPTTTNRVAPVRTVRQQMGLR